MWTAWFSLSPRQTTQANKARLARAFFFKDAHRWSRAIVWLIRHGLVDPELARRARETAR